MFDSCGPSEDTPASYMDYEIQKESRYKMATRRRKMDVMGAAMDMAIADIRHYVGMNSDNEERADDDEDYLNMSQLKQRYMNRKRHGSDETNNSRDDRSNYSRSIRGAGISNYVSIIFE